MQPRVTHEHPRRSPVRDDLRYDSRLAMSCPAMMFGPGPCAPAPPTVARVTSGSGWRGSAPSEPAICPYYAAYR
jgi:hypothetical protein